MLDLEEKRESMDHPESLVPLVHREIKDQEPRESPAYQASQDPKVTPEREESLALESREQRETWVILALLELKVPQVHLERRGPKEMALHVQQPCAWSPAPPKAEWRCSIGASGGQSVTITLTMWMGRSSAECLVIRAH